MLSRTKKQVEDSDFIFVFEGQKRDSLEFWKSNCESSLKSDKIQIKIIFSEELKQTYLLVAFDDYNVVYRQAETLQILKKREKRSFTIANQGKISQQIKINKDDKNYIKYLQIIDSRRFDFEISQQQKLSAFKLSKKQKFQARGLQFSNDEQLRCKYNQLLYWNIEKIHQVGEYMIPFVEYPFQQLMEQKGFVQLVPVQKPYCYKAPLITSDPMWWYKGSVEKYVGMNVQVYFCFIRFLQNWLWIPFLAGLLTIVLNRAYDYNVNNSPADTIYSFIILFWSIVFVAKWQKLEKWLKFKNNTGFNQSWAYFQKKIIQDDGSLPTRISLTTGEQEIYVPLSKKIFYHFRAWITILPVIALTIVYMIFSLNIRGFVSSEHQLLYWNWASRLAEPGAMFDKSSGMASLPVFLHVVIINYVDENIYRKLVISSTKKERHLETKKYQNSIIIKFLIYQLIITFTDLFYIAFVRFDIEGLKEQMASLFFMDIIRRVIVQTLIPYIKKKIQANSYKKKLSKGIIDQEGALLKQVEIQVNKPKYESFDDYLQIVTNFGYMVMLSSAFPSAPIWIMFSHFLQIIHDKYRILYLYKRSLPKKFNGIGSWKNVLYWICYFSILTNIMLFAFSSHQIASFFPKLFDQTKQVLLGNTDIISFVQQAIGNATQMLAAQTISEPTTCANNPFGSPGLLMSRIMPTKQKETSFLLVIFVIEHLVLFIFLGIKKLISNEKSLAEVFKERRGYMKSLRRKIDFSNKGKIRESMVKDKE